MTREQRLDVAARGLLALIGHGKGGPFKPDPAGTYNERVEALFAALAPESGGPLVVCGGCGNTVPLERDKDGWWRLTSHTGGECFSSGTFDYTGHDQPGGRLPPHDPPAPGPERSK